MVNHPASGFEVREYHQIALPSKIARNSRIPKFYVIPQLDRGMTSQINLEFHIDPPKGIGDEREF